jgi:hypothetical protein
MPVEHWDETAAKVEVILDSVTRDTSKQDLVRQLRAAISTTRTVQVSVVMRGTVTVELPDDVMEEDIDDDWFVYDLSVDNDKVGSTVEIDEFEFELDN